MARYRLWLHELEGLGFLQGRGPCAPESCSPDYAVEDVPLVCQGDARIEDELLRPEGLPRAGPRCCGHGKG